MFNEEETSFIKETAERDLRAIDDTLECLVNQMARLGDQLSKTKVVQSRLRSIVQAIKESQEERTPSRCC